MIVISDSPAYAESVLGRPGPTGHARAGGTGGGLDDASLGSVAGEFFGGHTSRFEVAAVDPLWRCALVSRYAEESQYARLIRIARTRTIPHGLTCLAGAGSAFQGFRGRSWIGIEGNLHLSVHLSPMRPIERFETVFMALAAVSVIDAIDAVAGLREAAAIRWVNDVVIGEAKVAGVLAYSQTRGTVVTSVILGIGINVETLPDVQPTPFVPAVAALQDFTAPGAARRGEVLRHLLGALARNYRDLVRRGFRPLMGRYRDRSAVRGRHVLLSSDDADQVPRVFAAGRVDKIGDGLELHLAGTPDPITRGRLILACTESDGADLCFEKVS